MGYLRDGRGAIWHEAWGAAPSQARTEGGGCSTNGGIRRHAGRHGWRTRHGPYGDAHERRTSADDGRTARRARLPGNARRLPVSAAACLQRIGAACGLQPWPRCLLRGCAWLPTANKLYCDWSNQSHRSVGHASCISRLPACRPYGMPPPGMQPRPYGMPFPPFARPYGMPPPGMPPPGYRCAR